MAAQTFVTFVTFAGEKELNASVRLAVTRLTHLTVAVAASCQYLTGPHKYLRFSIGACKPDSYHQPDRRGRDEPQDASIELAVTRVLLPYWGCRLSTSHTVREQSAHLPCICTVWRITAFLLSASDVIMRYHTGLYEVQKYMHCASAAPLSRMAFMGRTIPPRSAQTGPTSATYGMFLYLAPSTSKGSLRSSQSSSFVSTSMGRLTQNASQYIG
jgi:hypothetical protein